MSTTFRQIFEAAFKMAGTSKLMIWSASAAPDRTSSTSAGQLANSVASWRHSCRIFLAAYDVAVAPASMGSEKSRSALSWLVATALKLANARPDQDPCIRVSFCDMSPAV